MWVAEFQSLAVKNSTFWGGPRIFPYSFTNIGGTHCLHLQGV
jgi:hypothetical protein